MKFMEENDIHNTRIEGAVLRDVVTGEIVGSVSDISILQKCYDSRLFDVHVVFERKPTLIDASKLKRLLHAFNMMALGQILDQIGRTDSYCIGRFNKTKADGIESILKGAGFKVVINQADETINAPKSCQGKTGAGDMSPAPVFIKNIDF